MINLTIAKIIPNVNLQISRVETLEDYGPLIYFSDGKTEWCRVELTPSLQADLTKIFETDNTILWVGRDIELLPILNEIRAKLPQPGYVLEEAPQIEEQRRGWYDPEDVKQERYKSTRWY